MYDMVIPCRKYGKFNCKLLPNVGHEALNGRPLSTSEHKLLEDAQRLLVRGEHAKHVVQPDNVLAETDDRVFKLPDSLLRYRELMIFGCRQILQAFSTLTHGS
jgi:hypothetical protein